jgi:tetratricopeptide (TPR) repeat protein
MSEIDLSVNHQTDDHLFDENLDNETVIVHQPEKSSNNWTGIDIEFAAKIDEYEALLTNLLESETLSNEVILELLQARDAVEEVVQAKAKKSVELLLRLPDLDYKLRNKEEAIAKSINLLLWRNILNPPANYWWWFFDVPQVDFEIHQSNKLGWVWNILTIACLAGFTSFASKVIPIVFAGGVSVFESIGMVGPGGMIALVVSSMQGGEGKRKIQQGLHDIGIPIRFQNEVTFAIALLLFLAGYFAQEKLPKIYFNNFFKEGETAYRKGKLREAKESYDRALKIENQDPVVVAQIYTELGLLSESLGKLDDAQQNYLQALELGNNEALNNLARVKINKGDTDEAETLLNMALQRAVPEDTNELYQDYRNLGWANLEKKNYAKAEEYLKMAIEQDKKIPKGVFGKGLANCFLGKVYELQEKPDLAARQWNYCIEFAMPETFNEYKAILKISPEVGKKINSKAIFNGTSESKVLENK